MRFADRSITASTSAAASAGPVAASAASATPATSGTRPHPLAMPVLLAGTFMVVLDFFIVNVAIPSIQADLAAGSAAMQWVVIGYGLANAALQITGGRLGDLHGRRRVFMAGVALFTLASTACGLAPSAAALVAARVAQGAAGAILQPQVLAALGALYPGERRARAFAAYGVTMGLAAAGGQLIGGVLIATDAAALGWRACFLINVPVGITILALAPRVLPALRAAPSSRLDPAGALLVALAATALLLPLVQGREHGWPAWTALVFACGVALAAAFAWQQRALAARGGRPLLTPSLLGHAGFALGLGVVLAFFAGNAALYFVLAVYLQQGLGLSPLASGTLFTVMAVGFFAASMASPWAARRVGRRAIQVGALVLAAGHVLLLGLTRLPIVAAEPGLMTIGFAVQGIGLGLVMAPLSSVVLAGLPAEHAGVAAGVLATVQQIGNALGVALVGIVYFGLLGSSADAGVAGVTAAFDASLVYLAALALVVAAFDRRLARRNTLVEKKTK